MAQSAASTSKGNSWPPLVFGILGLIALGFWFAGTMIQTQTSEAWYSGVPMVAFSLMASINEIGAFFNGAMPADRLMPFVFAWCVQFALIAASFGIEMPKHPKWRHRTAIIVAILLIAVNSCGDYASSAHYGIWGQVGFTLAILFITFCAGLLAVNSFIHAFTKMTI